MIHKLCYYCGSYANRLDAVTWHCPNCGTLLLANGGLGVPRWALWLGWLLHPIRRFTLWRNNP